MPLAPKLTVLIDAQDGLERVRDQVGGILLLELANQQQLAREAGRDPTPWALRVYMERSNPWGEFLDAPDEGDGESSETGNRESTPIVNISFDTETFDRSEGSVVDRQTGVATFNLDCYGYGVAAAEPTGHSSGDEKASAEALRAARLVRNVLMAGPYTYLGLQKFVAQRWVESISMFVPSMEGRPVQHVVAARLQLQVKFNEFSPQYVGQPLQLISIAVKRAGDGMLLLAADYPVAQ